MSKRTRRQFLEESMVAVTAAASGASLLGGQTASAQSSSANERLTLAVIGVNSRGGNHINGYLNRKDCDIAYIVDVDEKVGEKKCGEIEEKTGRRPKWVKDMRRVFDDKSVDFISTATPNHWHALCGIWAMQAGKDVFLEKPVSHDIWEGRQIVAATHKYQRIVQAGIQSRSSPAVAKAIAWVKAGHVGRVTPARGRG